MATITTALTDTFKAELLSGVHDFSVGSIQVFRAILLKGEASLGDDYGPMTAQYSDVGEDELPTLGGYTRGGLVITPTGVLLDEGVAVCSFGSALWEAATFTTSGAVIYNDSAPGKPVCVVVGFGGDQTVSGAEFTLKFPDPDASNAVIRIE